MMKKGLQKSLALLLAVFMMFGAAPIVGTMIVFAKDPELKSIKIDPASLTLNRVGSSKALKIQPVWAEEDNPGTFNEDDVTWQSDAPSFVKVTDSGFITVLKLPTDSEVDSSKDYKTITITATYVDSSGNGPTIEPATAKVKLIKSDPNPENLVGILVTPETETLKNVGDTCQLRAIGTYKYDDGTVFSGTVTKNVSWATSNDKIVKVSSDGLAEVVSVPASNAEDVTVTITAICKGAGGENFTSTCLITVPKKHIYVEKISLEWAATAAVSEQSYKFDDVFKYKLYYSETLTETSIYNDKVHLSCIPADAVVIDNEKKTIQILPISKDKLNINLTLTAEDPSPNCKPVSFDVTVYKDVPLTGVKWDYSLGSTGKTRLAYYEKINGINQITEFYYEETVGSKTTYKYHTVPDYALNVCTFTVKSSDTRVLRVDEKTKRLIPVGNGEARLTITAKTPKGVTKSDTITVVVNDSPYNPITEVKIGYDEKTATNAKYSSETNTLTISYQQGITLKANVTPTNAKLDQKDVFVTTSDNRKIKTVSETTVTWSSSDPSIVSINEKGEVKVNKAGTAVITLRVEDNGVEFVKTVNVKGSMTPWQVVLAILMCIFTFNWGKIGGYIELLF